MENKSHLEIAKQALKELPEDADRDTILAAVHRQLTIDRDIRSAESIVEARSNISTTASQSRWSDMLGCVVTVLALPALFVAIPTMFSIVERIFPRPVRTEATGKIIRIEFSDGSSSDDMIGLHCQVTSDHLLIDGSADKKVIIPDEAYRRLELDEGHSE